MRIPVHRPLLLALALLSLPAAAAAQAGPPPAGSGIWIADASGRLRAVAPAAGFGQAPAGVPAGVQAGTEILLEVESFAHTATGALSAGALAARRVVDAVSDLPGTTAAEVLGAPAVEALYERPGLLAGSWEEPRRAGFVAEYLVAVRTGAPHRLGLLLDTAVGAGADYVVRVAGGPVEPPR